MNVSLSKSVILSEVSGGLTLPFAVRRAESKDLRGNLGERGIKFKLTSEERGEPAIGDAVFFAFNHLR